MGWLRVRRAWLTAHRPSTATTFRINTCKSVSKQRTLTPFRMNTCEKGGEGGSQNQPLFLASPKAKKGPEAFASGPSSLPLTVGRLVNLRFLLQLQIQEETQCKGEQRQ